MNTINEILKKDIKDMTINELELIYLEWLNDFLTIGGFSEYYNIKIERTCIIIDIAKEIRKIIYKGE